MATSWHDYLRVPRDEDVRRLCQPRYRTAFNRQRDALRRIVDTLRPKTVACLGAGVLNDIPYETLVRTGATIHLVDRLPGVIDTGLSASVIRCGQDGNPYCVYCRLDPARARLYCRHFQESMRAPGSVCERFAPASGEPRGCASYVRGEEPRVHEQDITGGYAGAFAEGVPRAVREVDSWRQAFRHASALAKRAERHRSSLDVPDGSVDLVTSAMVVSQFEHEPYTYFSRQAATRLGRPSMEEEKRLRPALETLRDKLLLNQVERHCDEIGRMLAPEGRCFMSFELFQLDRRDGRWFLVKEMYEALKVLGQRFRFDFNVLSTEDAVTRFETGESASLVYAFLLAPRA